MTRAERVVLALGAFAEAGQAAGLTQGADAVAAAGEDLVGVGLVANIPNQLVGRRVEHMMERDGELDHAKARAEMAAGHRDGCNQLLSQLLRQRLQLMVLKGAQIRRRSGYDQATAWDSRRSFALPGGFLGKEAMDQRVMHLYRP